MLSLWGRHRGRGVFHQLCRERLQHVVQEKLSATTAAEAIVKPALRQAVER